ncbi:MAG TPA: efflux RND transporter periplasmic adaptor subunit [Bacteroidales bacterium]|nr:efflux RND transporter periplasmic adaptor subunit [Bacteroidales bacterium]
MNMKKAVLIFSVFTLILIALFGFLRMNNTSEQIQFETEIISTGDINSSITATGSLEAITTVEVGTQVSGIIQKIFVDFNSVVKNGQTIAILDTTMLYSSLLSVKADVQQKSANLEYTGKNLERVKMLFESTSVAESDYDQAIYNYETAKANYDASIASLEKAQINLSYATIISPINGVVISRSVDEGQTVAASFNTPTLFTIAQDLTKMQVVASIDEADIGQVNEGNKVLFTVDAYPDDEFEGKVIQKRLEPTISQNVVTYNVLIDAPNPDLKLMPGMTASLTILVEEETGVLKVQSKALRYKPSDEVLKDMMKNMPKPGEIPPQANQQKPAGFNPVNLSASLQKGEALVWVKKDNVIMPRKIKTGLSNGTYITILEGLNEGDEIVLSEKVVKKAEVKESESESPFMPKRPGSNKK